MYLQTLQMKMVQVH